MTVEQIRTEIKRRKKEIEDACEGAIVSHDNWCKYNVLCQIESFIDSDKPSSYEQEDPELSRNENLKREISRQMQYWDDYKGTLRVGGEIATLDDLKDLARYFADWQRKFM